MSRTNFGPITQGTPQWAAEPLGAKELMPHPVQIDPYQFTDTAALVLTTSGAAALAVSIPLTVPTTQPVLRGTMLDFGGAKFARVSADAPTGSTAIAVDALVNALAANDVARTNSFGRRTIGAGTLIGRTYAERATNTPFGAAINTDDEFYILAFTIDDANTIRTGTAVKPGVVIKENYLPEWATISVTAALLAKLRATYRCIVGVN